MKKIIILGATGHVGAYTLQYLKEHLNSNEYQLIAAGRRNVDFFEKNMGIEYCQVDITKKEDFAKLPSDAYAVIHLAGIMPASMKGYDPYPYIDINIKGSLNVLEYCAKANCKKIIVTHTESDLSGYWESGTSIDPDLPAKFDHGSNYGMYIISRLAVREMCENYYLRHGITPYFIRCSTVYCYTESPYMYKYGEGIIPGYLQIYNKAMKGEPIEVWGDPSVKTDIVYVKDFAQIVEKMILTESAPRGYYNIGTDLPISLEDQIKIAIEVFGKDGKRSEIVYRPDKPNGRNFVMDISKTKNELGYAPMYDYRKYLEDYKKEMEVNRFHGLFTDRAD